MPLPSPSWNPSIDPELLPEIGLLTVAFARLEYDLERIYADLQGLFSFEGTATAGQLVSSCRDLVNGGSLDSSMSEQARQDYIEWLDSVEDLVRLRNSFLHSPWVLVYSSGRDGVLVQAVKSKQQHLGMHRREHRQWTPEAVRELAESVRALTVRSIYLPRRTETPE